MACSKCGNAMMLSRTPRGVEKCLYKFFKGSRCSPCAITRSLRHTFWFSRSKPILVEVMHQTYAEQSPIEDDRERIPPTKAHTKQVVSVF